MSETAEKPVETLNPKGCGPVVLLCEHASNHIPARYNGLGLTAEEQNSHIAWDPGALAVAIALSQALDAPLVASRISRLVYDCNRPADAPSAMPEKSEMTQVPGNQTLTAAERAERVTSVYTPFCDAVAEVLDHRLENGIPTVLVTVHSFTPIYFGTPRDVEIGVLHDSDSRIANIMLANADKLPHRVIRRNDPYGPADGVTHSLNLHAGTRGLANVMIEIRNDLLTDDKGIETLTSELLTLLNPALAQLAEVTNA